MKNLLVVGHSHIYALMKACDGPARDWMRDKFRCTFVELLAPDYQPTRVKGEDGQKRLNPVLSEALNNLQPHDALISCVGGNNHNIFGLLDPAIAYDFVLPEEPDLPMRKGGMVLPGKIIRARLKSNMSDVLNELALVRRSRADLPAIHLESPPTIPSEDHIRRHPGYFKDAMAKSAVAPATFRYKLWRLQSGIIAENCQELDMTFLAAPSESQDGEGMMLEQYWNPDPSHGNAEYGVLALRTLWKHLAG